MSDHSSLINYTIAQVQRNNAGMAENEKKNYSAGNIQVLKGLEAVRKRPDILVDATPNGIQLSAMDLDISIICGINGEVEEPRSTTVPGFKESHISLSVPRVPTDRYPHASVATLCSPNPGVRFWTTTVR